MPINVCMNPPNEPPTLNSSPLDSTPLSAPPPLPPEGAPAPVRQGARQLWAWLLSITLIGFVCDGILSTLDDSILAAGLPSPLSGIRLALGMLVIASSFVLYLGTAVSPMLPLRYILPMLIPFPLSFALSLFGLIYFPTRMNQCSLGISVTQLILGLVLLHLRRAGRPWTWMWFKPEDLKGLAFRWKRLGLFVAAHLLLIAPATGGILTLLLACAVDHYTNGFAQLRAAGLTMNAVSYASPKGKTVQLIPMIHIGNESFYNQVDHSFPSNSIILLEGVTDTNNLLRSSISYKRAAKSLGLAEQKDTFEAAQGESWNADVDVSEFAPTTIELLQMVGVFHTGKPTPNDFIKIGMKGQDPKLVQSLFSDLLDKRNQSVLTAIKSAVKDKDFVVVPWGAAHMPGLSQALLDQGYRETGRRSFVAIAFGAASATPSSARRDVPAGQPQ